MIANSQEKKNLSLSLSLFKLNTQQENTPWGPSLYLKDVDREEKKNKTKKCWRIASLATLEALSALMNSPPSPSAPTKSPQKKTNSFCSPSTHAAAPSSSGTHISRALALALQPHHGQSGKP